MYRVFDGILWIHMLPNIQYIVMFNDAALNVYTDGKDVEIVMRVFASVCDNVSWIPSV